MINEIETLMHDYQLWLADKTKLRQVNDSIEITTPYLDRHNDYLQIYVKRKNNGFLITDDGYTIVDLRHSGCNLDSKKRADLLRMTLNGFGVRLDRDALTVEATQSNFAIKKHNLVQAILAVNDLFYLTAPVIHSLFLEDVLAWMNAQDIRFIQGMKCTGASGYDHVFDMVIPKTRQFPDRFIRAINHPDREHTEAFAWAWVDTKEVRPESTAIAILNDAENAISAPILSAFSSYNITPLRWSERNEHIKQLAA